MRVPHFPYSIFMLCSYKGYAEKQKTGTKEKPASFDAGFRLSS